MNSHRVSLLSIVVFALFLSLLALPVFPPEAETQTTCPPIPPKSESFPPKYCWPSGARVKFYFTTGSDADGPFTNAEKNLYREAFAIWNQYAGINHNCSGVVFSETSGDYLYEVRKSSFLSDWTTIPQTNGSFSAGAITFVGGTAPYPDTSSIRKIIMIHEIGHSFGMNDCWNCQPCNASVMTRCTPEALLAAPQWNRSL